MAGLSRRRDASFVYDLDDPHCDALAGMVIDDGRRFTPARFVQSLDFMDDIVEPIAEQYAGNVTEMPCMMTATKFKVGSALDAERHPVGLTACAQGDADDKRDQGS